MAPSQMIVDYPSSFNYYNTSSTSHHKGTQHVETVETTAPDFLVDSTTLERWRSAVQKIPERCDLSGLSKNSVKYQLASNGVSQTLASLEPDKRSSLVADDLQRDLRNVSEQKDMDPRAMILFAVHQMLKGFGNGSHTTTASLLADKRTGSTSYTPDWLVVPSIIEHGNRGSETIEEALDKCKHLLESEQYTSSSQVDINELIREQLVDMLVIFDDGSGTDVSEIAEHAEFPLVLHVTQNEHWKLSLQYTSELLGVSIIDSFLSALMTLLASIKSASRVKPVADIELLPAKQLAQLSTWNNTDGEYPSHLRLHHLFEQVASTRPEQVALIYNDKRTTYQELNNRATLLAQYLVTRDVQPEQLVGLFLDKTDKLIATILGIWKSGAAHVPIDPGYPDERVKFVLDDTKVSIMFASERYASRLKSCIPEGREIEIISIEYLIDLVEQRLSENLGDLSSRSLNSRQLAYVTYTSGTTGYPKGIYKEHTSVVNSITDLSQKYGVAGQNDEVIMLFSAYVFEPFVRQMLMALTTGGQLAIINDEDKFDPGTLIPFIQNHKVTYLNGTASVLQEYDFTACPSLKRMILVGENLTDTRYKALRQCFKGRILNEYGFTESAFVTALNIFDPASERTDMSLGRPVRNVKCYILDANLKRVPIGVTGELHIGGLGISRGYMNRETLTRERFLQNPYQTENERQNGANRLLYKTGDLARWLPGGEVEYLGRVDFQIKLRGIRIEPGEIETNMVAYPGVRTSIVVSKKLVSQDGRETKENHLVGYFVCHDEDSVVSESDLLSHLESKLPRYMVPARLIRMSQIPVTINGKADLKALPAANTSRTFEVSADSLNDMERSLATLWSDVLQVPLESIGADSSFFRLGGHSIACIQLISRVRNQLGRGISIEEVFSTKTLQSMAALLSKKEARLASVSNPATKGDESHGALRSKDTTRNAKISLQYPATSLQQGFVYHSLKTDRSDAYVMQSTIRYDRSLDEQRYRAAWESVQSINPALRLRFIWDSEVMQLIHPEADLVWEALDWSNTPEQEDHHTQLATLEEADRSKSYHLDKGPLLRIYFIHLSQSRSLVLFSCHHAILDGWSLPLLFDSVHEAYISLAEGPVKEIVDETYVQSQAYLEDHRGEHLGFWKDQIEKIEERCDMNALLNEASRYKVPLADYDQIREQRKQTIELPWGKVLDPKIEEELTSRGITLHSILQLVWHLVLHSYGGGTHTVTGTTISGRHLPVEGIENAIGLFINTLPLVFDHTKCRDMTALEAVEYVQGQVNTMNSRGTVELGRLKTNEMKHGLFDTLFVLESQPNLDTTRRAAYKEKLGYEIEGGTEKLSYPLAVIADETEPKAGFESGGCTFTLCYASELFEDESIRALLQTVRDTFSKLLNNIHAPIRQMEYLSANQMEQLDTWNSTEAEFPNTTLHALFESEAQQKPEKVAVVYEDHSLTYQELNDRANAMAYYLLSKTDIKPNQLIALVMDKSEHMITSILAVWKTGGAYVPIDPGYPDDRIQYILEDTAALAVITDRPHVERLGAVSRGRLPIVRSDLATELELCPVHPVSNCGPADLAYIMYTSGTTGRPKGVMVEHHGVVNLCASLAKTLGLRDTDNEVILSFSNYVFDHFVEQMTDALLNGQTLVVLNDDMRGEKERLYKYIEKNRVTYLSGTPSVVSMYEFDRFRAHMRRIDCVGEAFSEPVFDKIRETFPGLVINGYGPTEVSITTHKRLYPYPERRTDKSIGIQISNSTTYVLNDDMQRVPIGAVGELFLGGDGVVRGYHNRPDLTTDRFPLNPFQTEEEKLQGRNARLYKTGDLVRWIKKDDGQGEIEYLGRNDFQVKIRGQRIELGEIEAVLSSYPGIQQSVVVARDREKEGQKYLVGYYVAPSQSLTSQAIRTYMLTRLPDYMVPAQLMAIEKVPVTVSGKLDSRALPVPSSDFAENDVVGARNDVEMAMVKIWSEILEIPEGSISIYSDFFSLGGDSLRSTRLSFAATSALGLAVSVSTLFKNPTIEALSRWFAAESSGEVGHNDAQQREQQKHVAALQDMPLTNIPVSPAQERLIFIHEFDSGSNRSDQSSGAYNICMHLHVPSSLGAQTFEESVRDVVCRHEALRTLIVRDSATSQHQQHILSSEAARKMLSVSVTDVDSEKAMNDQMAALSQHSFNLSEELPIRAQLYRLISGDAQGIYLSFVFHHLAFDAWSWDIFRKDLEYYYSLRDGANKGEGDHSLLDDLHVQYKEYAVAHRNILDDSEKHEALESYWTKQLSELQPLHLATDFPRPTHFDYVGDDVQCTISPQITQKLRDMTKREGASPYTVLVSAFFYLLSIYTNQRDIVIGAPVTHRTHADFESVIGFFVNLLPLRVQVPSSDIHDLIQAVQREFVEAQAHQDLPLQEMTKILGTQNDSSSHPIAQVVFNWETSSNTAPESLMQEYKPPSSLPSVAKFDLNVTVKETRDSFSINFNYATSLFNKETIEGYMGAFVNLLEQISTIDSNASLFGLSLQQQSQPLHRTSKGVNRICATPESEMTLSQLFEAHAASTPNTRVIASSSGSLTYSELNERANQLANLMLSEGSVKVGDYVAILLNKSIDTLVAILAVWKVGAAYLPLDPSYPRQRIQLLMEESNSKLVISTTGVYSPVKDLFDGVQTILLDSEHTKLSLDGQPKNNISSGLQSLGNVAYVIFTSGTTGKPKGVLVEHRSLVAFRHALVQRHFGGLTSGGQSVLFLSNYVFDFSIEQFALSILSGNKLVIPPEEGLTHEAFYDLAISESLTYISGTPSVLQQIELPRLRSLQMVTAAGEQFYEKQYDTMRAMFKGPINNAYGITETTVYNIVTTFGPGDRFSGLLRDSLPGTDVYVLNDQQQPIPDNAVGELYLGGVCLARGYLNQADLTQERFIQNPLQSSGKSSSDALTSRLYKTGDLVRLHKCGSISYLGRRDQQVKLRGFRIELHELRSSILSIQEVKEAAIIPQYAPSQDRFSQEVSSLICFYTLEAGTSLSPSDVRDKLYDMVPAYMVPSQIHLLEGLLPVTVNGKLDANQLLHQVQAKKQTEGSSPPRNAIESELCRLWQSLLDVETCGIDNDLFALGGDSISSLRLVGDIYRSLGLKVSVKDIFTQRTIRALHDNVLSGKEKSSVGRGSAKAMPEALVTQQSGDAPLLPIQEWFFSKPLTSPAFWNHCFTIKTPVLSTERLRGALDQLQKRHDVLRARFVSQNNTRVQSVSQDGTPVKLNVLNVENLGSPEDLLETLTDLQSHFDLENGPLYTVAYVDGYTDGTARVWFALHHLIVDTVSWHVLLRDLQALYEDSSLAQNQPLSSGTLAWAQGIKSHSMTLSEKAYWNMERQKAMKSLSRLPPNIGTTLRSDIRLADRDMTELLMKSAASLDASLNDVLLVSVGSALRELILDSPIMVTMEGHGRDEFLESSTQDVSQTVGWFTSMFPVEIPADTNISQAVVNAKKTMQKVPNHGASYGAEYGYLDGCLPAISFNYLGRLDQEQQQQSSSQSENWTLSLGEKTYPVGLCTSQEDEGRSSSAVDLTFSIVGGELMLQMSCTWGHGAANLIFQRVRESLQSLTETTSQPDFIAPTPSAALSRGVSEDYAHYFIFEGEGREGLPLFLLPPGEGGAESYFHNIVKGLPNRNLVVFNNYYRARGGSRWAGSANKDDDGLNTIESLAAYYLEHIRSIQPEGPYHILGWSFGGILALEAARILTKDHNQRMASLVLIDPYFDIPSAAEAIGEPAGSSILDPIYHVYRPDPVSFGSVGAATDRMVLYKAEKTEESHGTERERRLFDWYAKSCSTNHLDKYVSRESFDVLPLEGTHFTWVHDTEQVGSMCAVLEESFQ